VTSPADGAARARDASDRLRRLATYASVSVAGTLIAAKLGAYLVTGAVSLLSSLIDSSVDLIASLVTLHGVRVALRPADRSHRFGHGKAEPLAALAQAAFIVGSAVFLTVEAVGRLIDPQPVRETAVGLAVMGLSMALTVGLVAFQAYVVRRTGSLAIDADSVHYRADLLGNMAVIAALVLTEATGQLRIDPLFAVAIAAFLVTGAVRIAREALDVLMDRELPAGDRDRIRAVVMAHPQSRGLHDLRTRSAGDRVFIELHLELDPSLTLADAHDVTDAVEGALREAFPTAEVILHQEPEGLDDERLDHRLDRSR
jgi:ferrous-iron efflux pump FieF